MNSNHEPNQGGAPRFRPPLVGCVAHDRQLASALGVCYAESYASIARQIHRSLASASSDRILSDLLCRMAYEELEQMRTLGELIVALGGNAAPPTVGGKKMCSCLQVRDRDVCEAIRRACMEERRVQIDRYETLMSRTGDRVVRSVIAGLLSEERRMLGMLMRTEETSFGDKG